MKIMIVDDAVFIRKVLKGILTELGYKVVAEASTGKEAIEQSAKVKPDIITLDITLPDMSGIDVLREIKKVNPTVQIIMVSALSGQEAVMQALREGAVNYITKPFSKEKIESVLKSVCESIEPKRDEENKSEKKEKEVIGLQIVNSEEPSEEPDLEGTITPDFEISNLEEKLPAEESVEKNTKNESFYENINVEENRKIENEEIHIDFKSDLQEENRKARLEDIRVFEKDEGYVLSLYFNEPVTYNFGKMKIGNGFILNVEDCKVEPNVKETIKVSDEGLREIKVEEISGNVYIAIKTDIRKFNIQENDRIIEILLQKETAHLSYNPLTKLLLIEGISSRAIEVERAENNLKINIQNKDVVIKEEIMEINDGLVETIEVLKTFKGYVVLVKSSKFLEYEKIEGRSSFGIRLKEANVIKRWNVFTKEDMSVVEIISSSGDAQLLMEHDKENDKVYVYFMDLEVPDELLNQRYEYEDGFIEWIEFKKDYAKAKSYMIISTPVNKVSVSKEDGRILILCRAQRAFLLYDNLQTRLIFQNIKPSEVELELVEDKKLRFSILNRFVNLIKDSMVEDNQFIEKVEVEKVKNGYEGLIYLKKKCSFYSLLAKDKVSTDVYLTPLKAQNKINFYEYEERDNKAILHIRGEGKLEKEIRKEDGVIRIEIFDAQLENISTLPVEFESCCIEKIIFKEMENDKVVIEIYSYTDDFIVNDHANGFDLEFVLDAIEILVSENFIRLNGLNKNDFSFKEVRENNQFELEIKKKGIFIPTGLFKVEDSLIKSYQVYKSNGSYGIVIKTNKKAIAIVSSDEERTVKIIMKKLPELTTCEVVVNSETEAYLKLGIDDELFKEPEIEQIGKGVLEVKLSKIVYDQIGLTSQYYENGIVKLIEFIPAEENLSIRVSFNRAQWEIESNLSQLLLKFKKTTSKIEVDDSGVFIKYIDADDISYRIFEENGIIILDVPSYAGDFSNTIPAIKSEKTVKFISIEKIESGWRIYLITMTGIKYQLERKQEEMKIEFFEEKEMLGEVAG
ncbi:response regulator receiver protein [Caldicellulosiruptor owensensis OL]|uniref:Response regulator receiver protein n=1 Tax=Caldicellulosiruptor owensensis (strain ATCC 700167 / DSM 13100 / OL) TaxID=632518 RepID=E4Q3S0_CALOW|nr:response regulator [Caldicellulosiruptor owensensis]ADQ05150.1 response regulator receiver protein [Caldicellulosiruptor owensensis OL]